LSANGPILHPQLSGIVLVPVAPQALSNRPIVLPDTCTVTVRIGDETDARVNCDMQTFSDLHPGDRIVIQRSAHRIRFLHPSVYSYFATLRGKLAWQALPVLSARTP
jgi:NAD+ kinase